MSDQERNPQSGQHGETGGGQKSGQYPGQERNPGQSGQQKPQDPNKKNPNEGNEADDEQRQRRAS